jgi:hypothetical protein
VQDKFLRIYGQAIEQPHSAPALSNSFLKLCMSLAFMQERRQLALLNAGVAGRVKKWFRFDKYEKKVAVRSSKKGKPGKCSNT